MIHGQELSFWEEMRIQLQQPEYLHVLLHGLPLYGLFFGIMAMVVALIVGRGRGSRRAEIVALVLIFFSALSAWPVAHYGEKAYDNVTTLADADKVGNQWLDIHQERADEAILVFYALAALAVLAVFVPMKWRAARMPLFILTLTGAMLASVLGGWIAHAGGKVRHKEFRYGPPPAAKE